MSRYLLIDARCVRCNRAATVAAASGRLQVRRLDDPEFQAVVASRDPDNRRRPLLVVERDGRRKVLSGIWMAGALAAEIGPVATIRVLRVISEADPSIGAGTTRRTALQRGAYALAGVLFGVGAIEPAVARAARLTSGRTVDSVREIRDLRGQAATQQAEATYGEVDWDAVEFFSDPAAFYVLHHPNATSFIARDMPVAYVLTPDGGSLALEGPSGRRLGTYDLQRGRFSYSATALPHESLIEAAAPDIKPKPGFWNCFYGCIGEKKIPSECHVTCLACANSGLLSHCGQCVTCVGLAVAGTCAIDCWKET